MAEAPPRRKSAGSSKPPPAPVDGPVRVYLITGSEAGRKTAEAKRLVEAHVDADFADFDSETLDGATMTASGVLASVSTAPFGSGKRVLLVRDTQQMEAEEQKRLGASLGSIPSSSLLILNTGTPIMEEGRTKRGTSVETILANAVKKAGSVIDFAAPRSEDAKGSAQAEAKRLGKTLAPDAAALYATLPGDDLVRLSTEVAKAAAHAGETPVISAADVEATLSRGPDDVIFRLCDAVGARRAPEALGHVSTLFKAGGRPESIAPRVLVLLARQIRLITQFRYLGERRMAGRGASNPPSPEVMGWLPSDGAGGILTNPRMSWMADKYVSQARNFSGAELAERLEKLLQADLALKGIVPGGESPQAVLQRLVVELC